MSWPAARIQQALDSAFSAPAYQWAPPDLTENWATRLFARLSAWLDAIGAANPVLFRILLAVLVAVLAVIVAHGAWVLWRTTRLAAERTAADRRFAAAEPGTHEDALAAAAEAAAAGTFDEALRWRWLALERRLRDEVGLDGPPAMTPREAVRRAPLSTDDRARLDGLVRVLYDAVYAGAPFGADDFARWCEIADATWTAEETVGAA